MLPSVEEQQSVSRYGCIHTAATLVTWNSVAGDYLEFGVYRGDSFIRAYHSMTSMRRHRMGVSSSSAGGQGDFELWKQWQPRFFAFDSFAGLPSVEDKDIPEHWGKGAFACPDDVFRSNLVSAGVNLQDVLLVPGFYDKTLNAETKASHNLRYASIVHIDCDLYESTILALDFVTDLLRNGTVIVFDDWFFNNGRRDRGEQRACAEWLQRNRHIELVPYWREPLQASFIVNLR